MKSLAYTDIRKELEDFLRSHPVFKDFAFDASGISALLNTLAYNDHRLGYFAKMLLDESFVDTAHTLPIMLSHAKRVGFMARGKKGAILYPEVVVSVPDAAAFPSAIISVPRGTTFKSANASQDTRVFTVLDAQELRVTGRDGTNRLFTGNVLMHEGVIKDVRFEVNASLANQLYDVRDTGCDVSSLALYIKAPAATVETRIRLAATPEDVNPNDDVFYAMYDRLGTYKLFTSAYYQQGTMLRAEFLSTNGATGNGAVVISFAKKAPVSSIDINNFTTVTATTPAPSQGGADAQGVDELRRAIPMANRRQNRAVTTEDIKGIIENEFRDISTVNVWGGEDDARRRYGKRMICVVPKTSRVLSLAGREEIKRILAPYKIPGDEIVFVNARQQLVDIEIVVKRRQTSLSDDELRAAVTKVVDRIIGLTDNTSILVFSSYAIAAAVRTEVAGVDTVFPSLSFYNEVELKDGYEAARINYGNDIHFPPVITAPAGFGVTPVQVDDTTIEVRRSGAGVGLVKVVTTPVVPELLAARDTFYEVRSRKVRVI